MFGQLNIFEISARSASHAGARQAVVAENIAHADTPRYRARDIPSFATMWADREWSFAPHTTRPTHLSAETSENLRDLAYRRDVPADPNGNSVTLEREMLEAVAVARQHSRSVAVYKSALTIMRSAIRV